jgi:hypothetical protein
MTVDFVLQHLSIKNKGRIQIVSPHIKDFNLAGIEDSTDLLIIDMSTMYCRTITEEFVKNQFEKFNVTNPWVIITSNPAYYQSDNTNIIYYPFFVLDCIKICKTTNLDIKSPRLYLANFLTYHLHSHRLLTFLQLMQQSWFNGCMVNLKEMDNLSASQLNSLTSTMQSLSPIERVNVNNLFALAPLEADPADDQKEIVDINNRAFRVSYINIMTESDYPSNFITEKSIKPFLSGQFTAVIANPLVYKHLEELGFDMLSEYIDLNTNTLDIRKNITHLMEQVSGIECNIEEKWNESYLRRLHNYNLIRDPALVKRLTKDLQQWLDKQGAV